MEPYYGGINHEAWIERVMTATADEVQQIKAQYIQLIKRKQMTATMIDNDDIQTPHRRSLNEKKVHPQVVIQGDY